MLILIRRFVYACKTTALTYDRIVFFYLKFIKIFFIFHRLFLSIYFKVQLKIYSGKYKNILSYRSVHSAQIFGYQGCLYFESVEIFIMSGTQ